MLQNQVFQPKIVVIRRRQNQDYGFTLRHFIAYPPDTSDAYQRKAMETIFIKEVHPNGPAHIAGLQTGDRVLMVNNSAIAGISYSTIVSMIKQTPTVLRLQVVPKECDVLQMYYTDIAHTPETNRQADIIRPQIPITSTNLSSHNFHLNQRMISFSPEGAGSSSNSSSNSNNVGNNFGQIKQTTSFCGNGLYDHPRIMIEGCQMRSKPLNISVLQKPNNNDNDFMVRLRKSIEQKEEFLKSPIPHSQPSFMYHNSEQQQQQQQNQQHHYQLQSHKMFGLPITNSNLTSTHSVNNIVKQTNDLAVTTIGGINNSNCNSISLCSSSSNYNNSNAKNKLINNINNLPTTSSSSKLITTEYSDNIINNPHIIRDAITRKKFNNLIVNSNSNSYSNNSSSNSSGNSNNSSCVVITTKNTVNSSSNSNSSNCNSNSNNTNTIQEKFHKELEFLESLPEMGVTNQVFERKLVSNLAKGFDPFKPLSINTSGVNNSSSNGGNNCIENNVYRKSITAAEFELIDFHNKKRNEINKSVDNSLTIRPSLQNTYKDESSPENGESDEFSSVQKTSEVVRRTKPTVIDDTKPMRRISYLRANNNESNDYQLIDASKTINSTPTMSDYLTVIEKCDSTSSSSTATTTTTVQIDSRKSESLEKESEVINVKIDVKDFIKMFETEMEIKSSCIYGKRISEYRSWRQTKIELNGNILKISPVRSSKSENNVIEFNVKNFNIIDETIDKKKFVFKLQTKPRKNNNLEISMAIPQITETKETDTQSTTSLATSTNDENTEILFKTKSITEMKKLFGLLQEICECQNNSQIKQLAEPQKKAASASVSTNTYCDENSTANATKTTNVQIQITKEYSPQLSSKSGHELESLQPTTITTTTTIMEPISPLMKSRKSTHQKVLNDKDLGSPKTKNWKDMLFRRIHGNSGGDHVSSSSSSSSPSSNTTATNRYIGSIGVPLKLCPMSKDNEFLPNIVDVCTNIVETKGLNVIGIYRIPGNKAAISELKDQVNKIDFSWDKIDTDIKWDDVNVVSSLLKLFIRTLPDALLPSTFYINFIEADKKTGERRLCELKNLINALPEHSYETMKHLIRHLMRVSKNCEINLMEPKNLAIIFGPSIIRTPNETLEIAVKDMKHQCRIVELLLTQYDYFFNNGALPELEPSSPPVIHLISGSHQDQTTLLLDNVSKIEQRLHDKESSLTSRFIPHLRRRTHSKRSAISSDTYSGESVLSLEYKKFPEETQKENTIRTISGSKNLEHGNVEISISLTDEDSSNSRISEIGSMSLTTITDTLDSKLRNLRSESELTVDTTDNPNNTLNRNILTTQKPLVLYENIPYADESPERHLITSTSTSDCKIKNFKSQQQMNNNRDFTKIQTARFSSVYESSCSDDSEVSTTSDPKESIIIISPLFTERYKKRRDYRLFRSASFNCRNYSSRNQNHNGIGGSVGSGNGGCSGGGGGGSDKTITNLTKDEKTDMNLTKKRQIQNKQNRSIKRRHTVGGPHDYSSTTTTNSGQHRRHNQQLQQQQQQQQQITHDNSSNNHVLEVGIRIKNVNRRN